MASRTQLPQVCRWRLRPRSGQEAVPARQDGEERYALHGARQPGEAGGRRKYQFTQYEDELTDFASVNSPSGVRSATRTSPTSPTSWEF